MTPLHWAVMGGQVSHLDMVLENTLADVRQMDNEGRSPLNYAVYNSFLLCIRVSEMYVE